MLIDTHAHINHKRLMSDLDMVVKRAKENNLEKILIPNITVDTIDDVVAIEKKYNGYCHSMIGIHPTDINEDYEQMMQTVDEWAAKHDFCAIGEIGIDLYWDKTFLEQQKIAFRHQLDLANKLKKPVAIHVRESFDETFEVLDEYGKLEYGGVLHCFLGNAEQGKHAIDLGMKLGIGGVVTFPKGGIDKVLPDLPLEELMLETDAPFLSPVPYRGKRNEPAYVKYVAERVAEIYGVSVEKVAEITSANAKAVFNLD